LQQAGVRTPDKPKRADRNSIVAGLRKDAGQRLVAEVEHGYQRASAANPALI
jgi:hypothetical protein